MITSTTSAVLWLSAVGPSSQLSSVITRAVTRAPTTATSPITPRIKQPMRQKKGSPPRRQRRGGGHGWFSGHQGGRRRGGGPHAVFIDRVARRNGNRLRTPSARNGACPAAARSSA